MKHTIHNSRILLSKVGLPIFLKLAEVYIYSHPILKDKIGERERKIEIVYRYTRIV